MADDWAQTIGSEPGERIRRPYPPGGPPGGGPPGPPGGPPGPPGNPWRGPARSMILIVFELTFEVKIVFWSLDTTIMWVRS